MKNEIEETANAAHSSPTLQSRRELADLLEDAIDKFESNVAILVEYSISDNLSASLAAIKILTSRGYKGVFVSLNAPMEEIAHLMSIMGADTSKLYFVDIAPLISPPPITGGMRGRHVLPSKSSEEIVNEIYDSLKELGVGKKFVFVDSITSMALYKPPSEMENFFLLLLRKVREKADNALLILNVSRQFENKGFIRKIAGEMDAIIVEA